jgi:hypothetical protein
MKRNIPFKKQVIYHLFTFRKKRTQSCRIDTRKMLFFPRTVRDWNLLPPDIVELDTPEAFKARIVSL